ncbi:hypothetical protein ACFYT4_26730 [Streptomyces sp. NPDC004609]|uniref:hypothetical protein n=1 Tax=Streptomyces sp. NPDC004609 TaxID=3364704 RepID=UPI00368A2176
MSTAPTLPDRPPVLARRIAGRILAATLTVLGTVTALLGAGLSLIGLHCGGAQVAAGAGTPWAWLFLTAGAVLLAATCLTNRRHGARCCPARSGRPGRSGHAPRILDTVDPGS